MASLKRGTDLASHKIALHSFSRKLRLRAELNNSWLTVMPTRPYRRQTLGIDFELLGRELAERKKCFFAPNLLEKNRAHKQSELTAASRMSSQPFLQVNSGFLARLAKEKPRVIVLDDTLTTGTSLFQAAVLLRQVGVPEVIPLFLAKRPLNRETREVTTKEIVAHA